jgi:hypothetical protein
MTIRRGAPRVKENRKEKRADALFHYLSIAFAGGRIKRQVPSLG